MTLHDMEVAELSESQQQHYYECVDRGESPKMALLLATRHSPIMGGSDRTFNEGARRKMNNLPYMNRTMHALAKKAGINTEGKYHVAGLGRYDNPLAWVSTIDDVKESLKRQNLSSTGLVNYQAPERPQVVNPVPLADDIVNDEVSRRLSQGEQAAALPRDRKQRARAISELREQVIAEHGSARRAKARGGSPGDCLLRNIAKNRALQ